MSFVEKSPKWAEGNESHLKRRKCPFSGSWLSVSLLWMHVVSLGCFSPYLKNVLIAVSPLAFTWSKGPGGNWNKHTSPEPWGLLGSPA